MKDRQWTLTTWLLLIGTGLLVTGLQWFLLLLLVNRWTAKPLLVLLILLAAAATYFMTTFGVYLDRAMLRNLIATDLKEAAEFIDWKMIPYLLIYGVVPSMLLWRVRIYATNWKRALLWRGGCAIVALVMVGTGLWMAMEELAPLFREHHEVRYLVVPSNYIFSLISVVSHKAKEITLTKTKIGLDAHRASPLAARKPRALVIVVGETVRAANWGLNGYARQTTPRLATLDVVNFTDVTSCGTSTEVSVPCMFSPYGRHNYDENRVRHTESLLHVLNRAGVAVLWRDNQAGCKGVCTGLPFESVMQNKIKGLCAKGRCFDEVLLSGLDKKIGSYKTDVVIVLHMLGNHGPGYYLRYPAPFRHWRPTCDTADLGSCSHEALVNTYDNAVLYTDYVLAKAIGLLKSVRTHETALFYLSDHGESLGEHHLYLHGVPYAIAPTEQIKIPLFMWISPDLARDSGISTSCLRARAGQPTSHDYLFHTTLSLFDIATSLHDRQWDLTEPCRASARIKPASITRNYGKEK